MREKLALRVITTFSAYAKLARLASIVGMGKLLSLREETNLQMWNIIGVETVYGVQPFNFAVAFGNVTDLLKIILGSRY